MYRRFASLLLALGLAACGKVENFTDAAADDDVPADAAATGSINIIALEVEDQPNGHTAGVEVFAVGRDGTVGDRATTDVNGEATLEITAGDSVTAVFPTTLTYQETYITTVANVAPDDTLEFGYIYDNGGGTIGSPMTVSWNAAPNIAYYNLYASCAGVGVGTATSGQISRYSYAGCVPAGNYDFVVLGYDATTYQISYTAHVSAPWVDGGSLNMGALAPGLNYNLAISGLPGYITYASVSAQTRFGNTYAGSIGIGGAPTGGAFSGSGGLTSGTAGVNVSFSASRDNFGQQYQSVQKMPPGTSHTFASPAFLPWVGDGIINTRAQSLTWITDDTGADPADVADLRIRWDTGAPAAAGTIPRTYWEIILPGSTPTTIELPTFPAELESVLESAGSAVVENIRYIESDDVSTWREVLARPLRTVSCPDCTQGEETPPNVRVAGSGGQGGK
jgi:hypothetical protein